jgi:putative transposase
VLSWQRRRFRRHWANLSARPPAGRPPVDAAIQALVRSVAAANPLWGAPRIHGEPLKLGIDVAERAPQPANRAAGTRQGHPDSRSRRPPFNDTEHPTAAWTAQQIVDAFPDESAPAYLLRDRDQVYGQQFRHRVTGMGIDEVLTAPQSPWQNPFAERLIGSIRRECLNHVLVLGERHLHRILTRYLVYYHQARTHLALDKDTPDLRPIELPVTGKIVQLPEVGGLHHRYIRQAA